MTAIFTIGIDLAKSVFALHGVFATGEAVLVRSSVARAKLLELIASIRACHIGMDACAGVGSTRSPVQPPSSARVGSESLIQIPLSIAAQSNQDRGCLQLGKPLWFEVRGQPQAGPLDVELDARRDEGENIGIGELAMHLETVAREALANCPRPLS